MSLFSPAEAKAKRLKMYIYGGTGTGKTVTSLHFPNPAVIDTERGTEYYGGMFNFHRIETSDPDKLNKALDELLNNPGEFKTLVIDPFIHIYDGILDAIVRKQRKKTGNPDYELQPADYKPAKNELKRIVRKILSVDMNVIVTAPSKTLYSSEKLEFMKVLGTIAEGPKQLPHMFDVVLELSLDDKGKRWATVDKDRTNKLPKKFEFSYKAFTKYLGVKGLERAADVNFQQKELESRNERHLEITYKSQKVKTAGVTAELLKNLEKIAAKDMDTFKEKLLSDFAVDSVYDLRQDEAELFLTELTNDIN